MCTRYISPEAAATERAWHIGRDNSWRGAEVFPRMPGAFIRRASDIAEPARELVVGHFGLVPWFAKTSRLTYSTNNARFEEITQKAAFKDAWARGQRCIVPAQSFDEPNWEGGRNVWWRFWRADGLPWGLAGLWNTWTDKATGEALESFTMLTLNADAHALMRRMHRPDPRLPAERQDKRSVVAIEVEDVDQWIYGTIDEAAALVRLTLAESFRAGPAPDQVTLPVTAALFDE